MLRDLASIDTVVIHCADTPNGAGRYTILDVDDWHRERGFHRDPRQARLYQPRLQHVGYQTVIHVDGLAIQGRALDELGAHAEGYNARSIGLCLIGRDHFTLAQWEALRGEVESHLRRFRKLEIIGHRNVNPGKTCPGFDVRTWIQHGFEPLADHLFPPETQHG